MMNKLFVGLALLGAVSLTVGCDEETDGPGTNVDCVIDAECAVGQVCSAAGQCVTSTSECIANTTDAICDGHFCDATGNCEDFCASSADCAIGYECDATLGTCELESVSPVFSRILVISNVPTTAPAYTNSPNTAGPDLDTVSVTVTGAETFGMLVSSVQGQTPAADSGDYANSSAAEGAADSINSPVAGECTLGSGSTARMWAMGAGDGTLANSGYALYEFSGVTELLDGDSVKVWEVNQNDQQGNLLCSTGTTVDRQDDYDVYLVTSTFDAAVDDLTAANSISLGSGYALNSFPIILD